MGTGSSDIKAIKSLIQSVWNNEYNELELRLHRSSYNKKLKSFEPQIQLQRDTTFQKLKQMSISTDVDDTDHDAYSYLLSTYFPDDEIANNLSSSNHISHQSNVEDLNVNGFNKLKVRNSHFRSVTAD